MTCTSCGRDGGESVYCRACSAPLMAVCPKGHTSKPGSRFCGECRAPISIQPTAALPGIGCLSRVLAWGVLLGLVAVLGHLAHHLTAQSAVAVLGFFGVQQADLYNACTLGVAVPGCIALISFMLPGSLGPVTRGALWWVMRQVFILLLYALRGLGKALWYLAEGARPAEKSGRKAP